MPVAERDPAAIPQPEQVVDQAVDGFSFSSPGCPGRCPSRTGAAEQVLDRHRKRYPACQIGPSLLHRLKHVMSIVVGDYDYGTRPSSTTMKPPIDESSCPNVPACTSLPP